VEMHVHAINKHKDNNRMIIISGIALKLSLFSSPSRERTMKFSSIFNGEFNSRSVYHFNGNLEWLERDNESLRL
jgi:hypothetical protein